MDYDYVIVLDAMASGNTPGGITVLSFSDANARKRYTSQHDMSLVDMLVREGKPSGCLIGIEAEIADFGFDLSKTLQEKFEAICEDVQAEVLKIKKRLTNALKENKQATGSSCGL
jgi:hydrogenase maturation protease